LALANRLIEKEVIDSEELRTVIEANSPSPLIVPGTSSPKRSSLARTESSDAESPAAEAGDALG
jgi:hypothetical protein